MGSDAVLLAEELAADISNIRSRSVTILGQIGGAASAIEDLKHAAGDVVYGLHHGFKVDDIQPMLETLEEQLQVSRTIGVLSDGELTGFIRRLDALDMLLMKEKM